MIELIDLFFNQYLRIFVGVVLVGLILFSFYYSSEKKKKSQQKEFKKIKKYGETINQFTRDKNK